MRAEKPAELTQEEFDAWPWCAKEGCGNKCSLRLQSIYCHPHTLGLPLEFWKVVEEIVEETA